MPAARQRSRSPGMAWAVSATIGTRARAGHAADGAVAWKPSISGICTSIRITSNSAACDLLDRLAAVVGDLHAVPALLQHAADEHLIGGHVFGQQHPAALRALARARSTRLRRLLASAAGDAALARRACAKRDGEVERAAAAQLAAHRQAAAHRANQVRGDRQPQAGAAVPARRRGVDLREGGEDSLLVRRRRCRCPCRSPRTAARLPRASAMSERRRRSAHAAGLRELHRVGEQVDQHLPQPQRIAQQRVGNRRLDVGTQASSPSRAARKPNVADHVVDRLAQAEGRASSTNLPASSFEKSRISLSSSSSRWALVLTVCRYSRTSGESVLAQGQVGHADDGVHRRAQLVADVGQELALGLVGPLGRRRGPRAPGPGHPLLGLPRDLLRSCWYRSTNTETLVRSTSGTTGVRM